MDDIKTRKVFEALLNHIAGPGLRVRYTPREVPSATGKWSYARGFDPKRLPE